MRRVNPVNLTPGAVRSAAYLLVVAAVSFICRVACATDGVQSGSSVVPTPASTEAEHQPAVNGSGPQATRAGGLLEQSFDYRRQPQLQQVGPPAGYARAGGWYGYGFPVQSYRWGYFGAERNYPRVIWHTGYYGDCIRTAYRYGY